MQSSSRRTRRTPDAIVFFSLHTLFVAIAFFTISLVRLGDRPLLSTGRASLGGLVALLLGLLALALVIWRYRRSRRDASRSFGLTVALTVFSALFALLAAEAGVRLLSTREGDVAVFLGTRLGPRRWSQVVERNRDILERSLREPAYLVVDRDLGWTVGKSRQSQNGLYFSSVEGIRSPRTGVSLLAPLAGEPERNPVRVALVGDSYTFCEDVTYEETWGHQLAQRLGPGYRVINFGVPGYGVDQALLRYAKHAVEWEPDVAILGYIGHDLYRSLTIYNFLAFPHWDLPVSKPRCILDGGEPRWLNRPALAPEDIFSRPWITDLPFLDYDIAYEPSGWRFSLQHNSYLWRYLRSRFPPWEAPGETQPSMNQLEVNRAVLEEFIGLARAHDTTPVVVFFPATRSLASHAVRPVEGLEPGQRLLRQVSGETAISSLDLTEPLREIPVRELMSDRHHGTHYSARANARVARHLEGLIRTIAPR